ncbi:uncharacterized protein LOC123318296 [Coccinella septempunctata]|uniref:uncharacterized protein LOC123318296 n=1 Tax=Coccinella septempunctata TaxID=41139 RepID=UPI001D06D5E4|nr:uncharacterized protein LOC123318296 [Coccinella septempunctata]
MARVSLSPVAGTSLSDRDEVGSEVGALKTDESRLMMLVRAEVSTMRNDIRELKNSVTFFSDKITDFESKLTKLDDVFKLANQIRAENELLKKEISNIHFRLDTVEQNSRINNLEITDIPETKNENLNSIVGRIGEYVGIVVDPSAVSSVVRVPTKIMDKPKNIVVKFVSKLKRDELLSAIKVKRNNEGKNGFKIDGLSNRFFVNEHLTTRKGKRLQIRVDPKWKHPDEKN